MCYYYLLLLLVYAFDLISTFNLLCVKTKFISFVCVRIFGVLFVIIIKLIRVCVCMCVSIDIRNQSTTTPKEYECTKRSSEHKRCCNCTTTKNVKGFCCVYIYVCVCAQMYLCMYLRVYMCLCSVINWMFIKYVLTSLMFIDQCNCYYTLSIAVRVCVRVCIVCRNWKLNYKTHKTMRMRN